MEEQTMTEVIYRKKRSEDLGFCNRRRLIPVVPRLADSSVGAGIYYQRALARQNSSSGDRILWIVIYSTYRDFRIYEDPRKQMKRIFHSGICNNRDRLALKNSLFLSHGQPEK